MSSAEAIAPSMAAEQVQSFHSHPCYQEALRLRDSRRKKATQFLVFLNVLFLAFAASYVTLHHLFPVADTKWRACQLVELDHAGRIRRIGEPDLRWYLGRDQTAKLVAELTARSQQIDALEDKVVRQALFEFQVRFTAIGDLFPAARHRIDELAVHARTGDYGAAAAMFTVVVQGWSDDTRRTVGEKSVFDLGYGLAELQHLKEAQLGALGRSLDPPLVHQIFWMNPQGALWETVCWSFLGTLVNLLLNVSNARARGRFRPDEVWVCFAKLVYGPALSFVLVLTLYFGVLDAGTEMRFWFLPLAGFLFGYNARKTARVIDRLSAKLLGSTDASVDQLGAAQAQAAAQTAGALRAQARPASLAELMQQAPIITHTATVAAVIKQQNQP